MYILTQIFVYVLQLLILLIVWRLVVLRILHATIEVDHRIPTSKARQCNAISLSINIHNKQRDHKTKIL